MYMGGSPGRGGGDSDAKSKFFVFSPFDAKISFRSGGGGVKFLKAPREGLKGVGWGGGTRPYFGVPKPKDLAYQGLKGCFLPFYCPCVPLQVLCPHILALPIQHLISCSSL